MRSGLMVSCIAVLGVCVSAPASLAAGAHPMVIPGIGPPTPLEHAGRRAQAAYRHAAAPAPAAPSARGQYGGGFIELLLTGSAPAGASRSVIYNRPPDARTIFAPRAIPPATAGGLGAQGSVYAALPPAEPVARRSLDPQFLRQDVVYSGPHGPGTIIVDTPSRHLFLVTAPGRAIRYGIGVGRPGFEWAGVKSVTRKAEWPDWRPPPEMLKRRPDLPKFMPGGPDNPLGARALYLGSSLYRIHGTNEPHTIGQNVSSGCIRMMNEDVIDLYNRVRVGAKVIVR